MLFNGMAMSNEYYKFYKLKKHLNITNIKTTFYTFKKTHTQQHKTDQINKYQFKRNKPINA